MITMLQTLSPVPRRRRWGRDSVCTAIAVLLLAMLFCGCQSAPKKPPHPSGPDHPYPSDVLLDPVTERPPNVQIP